MRSRKWMEIVRPSLQILAFAFGVCFVASSASARTWYEITSHLGQLGKQVETYENEIRALIQKKKHTNDEKEIAAIIVQLGEQQKLLEKVSKTYEQERQESRFEYPERNDQLDRTYVRHELKTLDDFEHEKSLDSQLDEIREHVLAIFPLPAKPQAVNQDLHGYRKPASIEDDDAPEEIHLIK